MSPFTLWLYFSKASPRSEGQGIQATHQWASGIFFPFQPLILFSASTPTTKIMSFQANLVALLILKLVVSGKPFGRVYSKMCCDGVSLPRESQGLVWTPVPTFTLWSGERSHLVVQPSFLHVLGEAVLPAQRSNGINTAKHRPYYYKRNSDAIVFYAKWALNIPLSPAVRCLCIFCSARRNSPVSKEKGVE